MRVQVHPDAELDAAGFRGFPRSGLRFPPGSYEPVERPEDADAILCPLGLDALPKPEDLRRIPHYRDGFRERFVFLNVSDLPDEIERREGRFIYADEPAMFVRCNVRPFMLDAAPNTIPMAWPVGKADLDAVANGRVAFARDVGFHGWLSTDCRKAAVASAQRTFRQQADIVARDTFYGYTHRDHPLEAEKQRTGFIECMARSRLQLCPQSIKGVWPYRFFETMCAGRVAVAFVDDPVWPWADDVPGKAWRDFCFCYPASDAENAGEICRVILDTLTDEALKRMGALARDWFMTRLDDRRWPELHRLAVERSLRKRGLLED